MKNIFEFFRKNDIGEPPWEYDFLVNLPEREYPKYLAKIFKYRTGEKLPLRFDFGKQAWVIDKKRCKTFNQKIQWIKLYGVTDLMRQCTDKVAVRDYVAEKIGSEYLKPVLQIIPDDSQQSAHVIASKSTTIQDLRGNPADKNINNTNQLDCHGTVKAVVPRNDRPLGALPSNFDDVSTYFDQINWNKLPNSFVIKCNHGCKWLYIIKDKEQFLNTPQILEIVKRNMTGWLEQEYFPWNGFEMQYKGIKPKILVENYLKENNKDNETINVYCFNGIASIFVDFFDNDKISICNENFCPIENFFQSPEKNIKIIKDINMIKKISKLSSSLSQNFRFVRVDWVIYKNKPYFEELTFSPYSGFNNFKNKSNIKLGNLINL